MSQPKILGNEIVDPAVQIGSIVHFVVDADPTQDSCRAGVVTDFHVSTNPNLTIFTIGADTPADSIDRKTDALYDAQATGLTWHTLNECPYRVRT